jgi:uncharacterized membrane protein YgaE (UPF0421/DUF939 family)
MKKTLLIVIGVLICFILILQLFSPKFENPPVKAKLEASPEVQKILQDSCYDCHSNETKYPWYASIAPVSFLVAHDIKEGRRKLNFSEWNYSQKKGNKKIADIREEVLEDSEMPPWFYVMMHSKAKMTDQKKEIIRKWSSSMETGNNSQANTKTESEDEEDDD